MEEIIKDKILGGMWGLLIGDAFGVPYEFKTKKEIPKDIPLTMSPKINKTYPNIKFGTWSDDGAQALCLAQSLIELNKLDEKNLGNKLVSWYKNGYMAVDNNVFDYGITTQKSLLKIIKGINPKEAGIKNKGNNGNGSLMRVLPLAIWHKGKDVELINDAFRQSKITHGHKISQICCGIYCLWARNILKNINNPYETALQTMNKYNQELIDTIKNYTPKGTGFVIDCLVSSKWASEQGNFNNCLKASVSLGNDTDTTACVTSGIVGLKEGLKSIQNSSNLFNELRGKKIAEPVINSFVEKIIC